VTIPDWLGSLATLAIGAGIYMHGYRNGAKDKAAIVPPDPYLRSGDGAARVGDTIHVNANTPEEAAEFVARLEAKRDTKGDVS